MSRRATPYIDRIAPEHSRVSCSDDHAINGRFAPDDLGGCYRCTLLNADADTDLVAPEHEKTSCADSNANNARVDADDHAGCYRCTLLTAKRELQGETVTD